MTDALAEEELRLSEADDELDFIMLRRDKLVLLVARLRSAHKKLTRTRRYWPLVRQHDTHADEGYTPPREERPWQAKPSSYRKGRTDDNPKGLWRKAKLPW